MIQRIQTLYLLGASVLMFLALFMPLADFAGSMGGLRLWAFGVTDDLGATRFSTIYMGVVLTLGAVLPLIAIFLFKKRRLQLRLCATSMVLLLGGMVFICLYVWRMSDGLAAMPGLVFVVRVASAFPLVAFILVWLAYRAVRKDEKLVKSLDRIR